MRANGQNQCNSSAALVYLQSTSPAVKPATVAAKQQQSPKPDQTPASKPTSLAAYIIRDTDLLRREGWTALVQQRCQQGDFTSLETLDHPGACLINFYSKHGVPAKMSTFPWSAQRVDEALNR